MRTWYGLLALVGLIGFIVGIGLTVVFFPLVLRDALAYHFVGKMAWSPDSRQLAFSTYHTNYYDAEQRQNKIYVIDVEDRNTRTLTNIEGSVKHIAWSPDMDELAYVTYQTNAEAITVDVATGEQRLATPDWFVDPNATVIYPNKSPDEAYVAVERCSNSDVSWVASCNTYHVEIQRADTRGVVYETIVEPPITELPLAIGVMLVFFSPASWVPWLWRQQNGLATTLMVIIILGYLAAVTFVATGGGHA